jgi:hypothetical protein
MVLESYAYAAASWGGLRMLNVLDPSALTEVGSYATDEDARGVGGNSKDAICVAAGRAGLLILFHAPKHAYLPLITHEASD